MKGPEGNNSKTVLTGIVLGITAMLPGISGATMAVLMGIYERLIRDLADLRRYLREDFWFILFLAIGAAVGTFVSAKVLNTAIDNYPGECMLFFAGLILGQVPQLRRMVESSEGGRSDRDILAFAAGIAVMGAIIAADLLDIGGREAVLGHDTLGYVAMLFMGIVIAVSALMPGISHSTVLIVFGLFSSFTAAISDMDAGFLITMALGLLAGILMFSNIIHLALERHHRLTMFLILGLTVGSLAAVLVAASEEINGMAGVVAGAASFAVGLIISILSLRVSCRE